MALLKTAVKAAGTAIQTGAEKVLRSLPTDQADIITKTLNFKTGSPEDIFVRGGGIHPTDGPGIINSIQKGEAQNLGQHITNAVQGEPAALNEIGRFSDNGTNQVTEDTIKANGLRQANSDPFEIPKQPNVIEVGGKAYNYDNIPRRDGFDMAEADELMQTPEMQKAFSDKQANIETKNQRMRQVESKTEADYPKGKFYRQEGDIKDELRKVRDAGSGANPEMTRDILGVQAEPGYGVAKGKTEKTAYREASLGFKPDNKGRLMNLEQHHAAFPNAEGSALMGQEAIQLNPTFELAVHRYVARKYDSAFGPAAKNMANLPYDVHQQMLHRWLEKFNLEDYWRNKLKANPQMSPAEIISSLDEYFQEIVYPTMAMLDGWMAKSDPSKFNAADVRIPKKLTAQARSFLKKKLKETAYDPTAGGTRNKDVSDVMLEKFRRQTNDGAGMFKLRVPTEGMNL